jgi:hypothetical protein
MRNEPSIHKTCRTTGVHAVGLVSAFAANGRVHFAQPAQKGRILLAPLRHLDGCTWADFDLGILITRAPDAIARNPFFALETANPRAGLREQTIDKLA